jgi:hypothetical protein
MPNVDSSEYTRFRRFLALRNDVDPNAVSKIKFRGPASVSQPRVPYALNFLKNFIPKMSTQHSTFAARQYDLVRRGR